MQPLHVPFNEFDQEATVVSFEETADGYGGLSTPPAETIVSTEYVSIEFRAGMEITEAGRIVGTADYLITMWYNSNVTLKTIIKTANRSFNIIAKDNVGFKNEYLVLYCNEVV